MTFVSSPIAKNIFLFSLLSAVCFLASTRSHAADSTATSQTSDDKERNFYQVLDDLITDFEFDLKNGNVAGLKDVSIRNIALSENVPPSFKNHLELLITERIMKNTKARVLQCLACKAKRTTMNGDQVIISSPDSNPVEIARIAKTAGISNFLDVSFSYQQSGMILSMFTSDPETGSIVWSHSYNSETSRAAAFRRGVDFSQTDEARRTSEYTPVILYRPTIYYLSEPNFNGVTSGVLGFAFGAVERYDNRKKEVGFQMDYLLDTSTLSGGSSTGVPNLYAGFNLSLLFIHAWNLIGEEENFNKPRGSLALGIGGTYGSGFLGALARASYEYRLGKHYAISGILGYRPKATPFINGSAQTPVSGMEFGLGVSALF